MRGGEKAGGLSVTATKLIIYQKKEKKKDRNERKREGIRVSWFE